MTDKGSKVMGVYSAEPHLYTPGLKRVGGPLMEGGKPNKQARYVVTDLLPDDEQGQAKWRGDPADTYSDWTIEVTFEGPVPVPVAAPAPAPEIATSTAVATPDAKPPQFEGQPAASFISPEAGGVATTTTLDSPVAPPVQELPPAAEEMAAEVIEIQTQINTYHIHRFFLGFGSRRSEYFARLFKESKGDINAHMTRLELEPLEAKAFPDLLDFLYEPSMPLVIETETATALHHLGVRFEMAHLQHYAKEFCHKDLSLETLETYYQHAKLFEDQVVLDMIVAFLAKNITAISATSNFVRVQTDAKLWKAALEHIKIHPVNFTTDLHLSKLISEFGVANKGELDAQTFHELTDGEKLRKVDPVVALDLCDLEDQLFPPNDDLSSLQQRCATALSETWKDLDASEEQVKTRKAAFLVDLLGKVLTEAKHENERMASGGKASSHSTGGVHRGRRGDRVESTSTPTVRKSTRSTH